eukprot:330182-Pleurochrysis_carterae.AAC.1
MFHTNSCEYEPWQNRPSAACARCRAHARVHERGGAGVEYWEYSMTQASLISNVTHHCWVAADNNKTPHERKAGRPPSVSHFRPMFCL